MLNSGFNVKKHETAAKKNAVFQPANAA